jgi:Ferritin-like domain
VSVTRREIVAAGIAAGMAVPAGASAQASGVGAVERLLTFESRLEGAYRAALERQAIEPRLGRRLLAHEREHVRGVEVALRALGRRRPRATVPMPEQAAALASPRSFARFALSLEEETTAAYAELLAGLSAPGLLQPLGSIMACGAQHQVALRALLGRDLLADGP